MLGVLVWARIVRAESTRLITATVAWNTSFLDWTATVVVVVAVTAEGTG